jgi:hypothetical protein
MENLHKQPFLLSMKQAVDETGDLDAYKTLLHEQQSAFKEYLNDSCHSDIPAPIRYQFLQSVDYEVCSIRLMCADKIRANDAFFYRFWAMMIVDTRRYINAGIKTLEFLRKCPPHILSNPAKTFPDYTWTANRNDMTEVLAGIFLTDVIRLKNGKTPSFAMLARFVGNFFGIDYSHPSQDFKIVIDRKRNQTPFLHRLIESIRNKNIKRDALKK